MARHREYDRTDVLNKAVDLFWQKGYKASSMADIVQKTGLNTASMYKEFNDKDGLFEEALIHYRDFIMAPRMQILIEQPNLNGVEAFLENVAAGAAAETYKGCLMMNHLTQKHSLSDPAIDLIEKFCAGIESLLETALRNAQKNDEISTDKDPVMLASFIMCTVHGLSMYGRRRGRKARIVELGKMIACALK